MVHQRSTDIAGHNDDRIPEIHPSSQSICQAAFFQDLQKQVLEAYMPLMDCADDKDTWFGKMKDICEPLGMSPDVKAYKAAPDQFKGHVGDVSAVVRMAICGRRNTPDLHAIMALLGQEKCLRRLDEYKAILEGKKPFADAIPGHTGFVIK